MLPGGVSLGPGEVLLKKSTLHWADPSFVPATPFSESCIIVTNQRLILLGEAHHEYKIREIHLSSINRAEVKRFPGAGIVKMFAGMIVIIEYRDQDKIKIVRIGVSEGQSIVNSIEEARMGAPTSMEHTLEHPQAEDDKPFYCTVWCRPAARGNVLSELRTNSQVNVESRPRAHNLGRNDWITTDENHFFAAVFLMISTSQHESPNGIFLL